MDIPVVHLWFEGLKHDEILYFIEFQVQGMQHISRTKIAG